jgi:hypothetical protein
MARRQVSIFINGNQVANQIKSITAEQRKISRELSLMTRGTAEYEAKVKELRRVNGIIKEHRDNIRGVESTWDKVRGSVGKFAAIAGVTFAADQIISYGKELFRLGSEMEVLQKKAETVFGEVLPQVTAEAEKNATAMGVTTRQYIDAAAAIGDLLIPMKFTRQEAADISTSLVNLSGALSEWTGGQRSAEEVSKILSKALLGEREQLKELGISIQEADVTARLAEKGLKGLTGEMLQQAKAAVTLELITEKTADAQTAFANNADTLVRKQAELSAQFRDIKETVAQALIPVFNRLLEVAGPVITQFFNWVKAMVSGEKQTGKLSGVLKVMGIIVTNAFKVWSQFYGAIYQVGQYLFEKLSPVLTFVGDLLVGFYNTVVAGVNKFNELLGIELRLEKIDTSVLNDELKKEQEKLNQNPLEVEVKTKTDRTGLTPEEAAEKERRRKAAEERRKEQQKEDEREAKELKKRLERTKALIEKHAEEIRLAQLDEDNRALEQIRLKYQKEIEEAEGFKDEIKELERLRDQELRQQQDKFNQRDLQEKIEAQARIQQELLSERELEMLELETHFQNLFDLAEKHEIDISELKKEYEDEKKAIDEKYKKEQTDREKANNEEQIRYKQELYEAEIEIEQARIGLYATVADQLTGIFQENEKLQTALFLFQKGLAIAEIVLSLQKQLAAIRLKYALIPGGFALAAAEGVQARIAAATSLATIAGTIVQKFIQKKDGGWLTAFGADDNIGYNAKYIGQPVTGMLPNHPVLMNSSSGSPVLASERGREYFVSNASLRNPYVMNYVRAIDNIVKNKHRQYAEGGSTGTAIPQPPPQPQDNEYDNSLLLEIARLNDILEAGVVAWIKDDMLIEVQRRLNQLNKASGGALGQ